MFQKNDVSMNFQSIFWKQIRKFDPSAVSEGAEINNIDTTKNFHQNLKTAQYDCRVCKNGRITKVHGIIGEANFKG